jgi:hypothetical protein
VSRHHGIPLDVDLSMLGWGVHGGWTFFAGKPFKVVIGEARGKGANIDFTKSLGG